GGSVISGLTETTTISGTLTLTSGSLNLNAQQLTLSGTIAAGGSGALYSTSASSVLIIGGSGSGSMGSLGFASGGQTIGTLTMGRSGGAEFGLGSLLTVTTLNLTNGVINNSNTGSTN